MIHLVGLPHTSLDEEEFTTCAFTTKAARWTKVLEMAGHKVTAYWSGGTNTVDCEVVEVLTQQEREDFFGPNVGEELPSISWEESAPYWSLFNQRAKNLVAERIQPGDMVAIMAGSTQQSVVDAFPGHLVLEPCVGYHGLARDTYACFESYSWMHNRYGAMGLDNGRFFDAVVPNFVYRDAFEVGKDHGYALFMGRLTGRKGPHVAAEIAERAGLPLVVAGAGMQQYAKRRLVATDGTVIEPCQYEGIVRPATRKALLSHASVVIMPTLYIEPFGTVHAEAMASGVPVLASDFGVFPEVIQNGVNGYRFRTLAQAAEQVPLARALRGENVRSRALERYSLEAVAPMFDEWLWRLNTIQDGSDGWNAPTYWQQP